MLKNDCLSECGSIHVICGPMFAGKTSELIKRLKNQKKKNKKVMIFKPEIDIRYNKNKIVSHNKKYLSAIQIKKSEEILIFLKKENKTKNIVIGIDEAQFFDKKLPEICNKIANMGNKIFIAGLDMDSNGEPFGPMPFLLAISESITKMTSKCSVTGNKAYYTKSISNKKLKIKIGDNKTYTVLCRNEFYKNEK